MISLIIPCFNEEESLPLFYPEVTSVLQEMNCDYELIFVNDGSRDRTLEILKELSEKDPHVIYLSFSRIKVFQSELPLSLSLPGWKASGDRLPHTGRSQRTGLPGHFLPDHCNSIWYFLCFRTLHNRSRSGSFSEY